ncbi:hypothetical protein DAPPUDRAFT_315752 [Daphnia pulex]|uniref:Uncharacterized protein n=1 Tax=Daphnia pulex TaxID=6669 RepID=E9GAP9_DAPPU|nr:hypothetical protein DAPPUDRAFT_315752 [Daphnia pulex]|eukprot:EFX83504.1 hypothetical protein DAPPUDRAFT_315752 [Daphnia pulex]
MVNCGIVLLLSMASLKAGLIIGVLRLLDMAVHHQRAYVHLQEAEYYTYTYATPVYYTEEFKCYCASRNDKGCTINASQCPTTTYAAHNFTEAPKYYTIKAQPIRNQT